MAVILELWRGSCFFRCAVGGPLFQVCVCASTQSDWCSYVFVDLGLLDLYMI